MSQSLHNIYMYYNIILALLEDNCNFNFFKEIQFSRFSRKENMLVLDIYICSDDSTSLWVTESIT